MAAKTLKTPRPAKARAGAGDRPPEDRPRAPSPPSAPPSGESPPPPLKKPRGRKKAICIYVSPEGVRKLEILASVRGFPSASSIFEEGIHRLFAQDSLVKGQDVSAHNQPPRRSIFGDDDPA